MSEFTRPDYLRIKWPFVALAVSAMVGIGLFGGLRVLNDKATIQLRQTSTAYEEARQKVEKISQEEASIRANIGQYQSIKQTDLVGTGDLLQMKEHFLMIRSENKLYTILVTIAARQSLPIAYGELDGKRVDNPGRPVVLQVANINFKLPLLHENDLANLLNGLLSQREVLQVRDCNLVNNSRSEQSLVQLGQHFSAECNLAWYSVRFEEPDGKTERKQ